MTLSSVPIRDMQFYGFWILESQTSNVRKVGIILKSYSTRTYIQLDYSKSLKKTLEVAFLPCAWNYTS